MAVGGLEGNERGVAGLGRCKAKLRLRGREHAKNTPWIRQAGGGSWWRSVTPTPLSLQFLPAALLLSGVAYSSTHLVAGDALLHGAVVGLDLLLVQRAAHVDQVHVLRRLHHPVPAPPHAPRPTPHAQRGRRGSILRARRHPSRATRRAQRRRRKIPLRRALTHAHAPRQLCERREVVKVVRRVVARRAMLLCAPACTAPLSISSHFNRGNARLSRALSCVR